MQKPVYTMQAHGCDMRNALGGVKTLHVPENCVYVTLAACGKVKKIDRYYAKLIKLIDDNHFSIRDPVRYKTTIEELIELPIHVHHPAARDEFLKTYVDNTYYPFFAWHCDENGIVYNDKTILTTHVRLLKSGLYTTHSSILNDVPENIETFSEEDMLFVFTKDGKITEEMVRYIYENSIEPSADKIMANLQKYKKSTYSFDDLHYASGTITQSELFKQRPGIYYNAVCRNPCKELPYYDSLFKPYELRRQKSDIADQGRPILTNIFLYPQPNISDMPLERLKSLSDFSIKIANPKSGNTEASINWEGPVNLIGCNLDEAIKIKRQPNYIDIDVDYKTYPGLAGNCTIRIDYDEFKNGRPYNKKEIRKTIEKNHYTFVSFENDELIMTKYFKDAYDDFFVDDSTSWFGLGGKTRRRKTKRKTMRKLKL
jgi:hypothetical protein